jgi:hypothetical protein
MSHLGKKRKSGFSRAILDLAFHVPTPRGEKNTQVSTNGYVVAKI